MPGRALVVIDYQNDFVDGSLGFPEAASLEEIIADKVIGSKIRGDDIYFTRDCHGNDYLRTQEGRRLPVEHCISEEGRDLFGSLKGLSEGCTVIDKPTFGSLELGQMLASKGYEEIELCGILSDICVVTNAAIIKTALPEARIIVDSKAVASNDRNNNEAALRVMRSIQIDVI